MADEASRAAKLAALARAFGGARAGAGMPAIPLPAIDQLLGDAPPRLPDSPWRAARPIDGCPGSFRQYRGVVLIVRRSHLTADRPGCYERLGRWYASVDGAGVLDCHGRQYFADEAEARAVAEAVEEGPPVFDGHSYVV
jgi:hypothetical protein